MALSEEKKARLREELGPLVQAKVQEAFEAGMTPKVQEYVKQEIARITAEHQDAARSYSARILSDRDVDRLKDIHSDPKAAGIGVARLARCIALGNNDPEVAARIADDLYDDDLGKAVNKVLSSGDADSGGVFIPPELADTFIDALRATAVVRQAGLIEIDLAGGSIEIPRVVTDPTAGYIGENEARNASNLGTGSLRFTSKTLQGKTATTQKLLRRSGQNAEQIMRNNLVRVMANVEDDRFLQGVGTENSPKGMRNWAPASSIFTQTGTTLTAVLADLRTLIGNLEDNDVPTGNAQIFLTPRSRSFLAFELRDTEDRPAFKDELTQGEPTIHGFRARVTNNIPNTLGAGNNESRVMLTAMDQAWLAEESGLRIRASTEASFLDENGNTVSAFDKGLMVIIIEREHDFAMAHGEAVSVLEGVTWGV